MRIYSMMTISDGRQPGALVWKNQPQPPRVSGPFPSRDRLYVGSGFVKTMPTPILAFRRTAAQKKPLQNLYGASHFWAVSEALKQTLCEVDAEAFDMVQEETWFSDDKPGPDYWLVDLIRTLDCYDTERSIAANPKVIEHGVVNFAFDGRFFSAHAIGEASFFRIPQSYECLCTAQAKERLQQAVCEALIFSEVGWAVGR